MVNFIDKALDLQTWVIFIFQYNIIVYVQRIMRAEICWQEIYRSFVFTCVTDEGYKTTEI